MGNSLVVQWLGLRCFHCHKPCGGSEEISEENGLEPELRAGAVTGQPRDGLGGSRGDDLELVGWWGSGGGEEENWICGGL